MRAARPASGASDGGRRERAALQDTSGAPYRKPSYTPASRTSRSFPGTRSCPQPSGVRPSCRIPDPSPWFSISLSESNVGPCRGSRPAIHHTSGGAPRGPARRTRFQPHMPQQRTSSPASRTKAPPPKAIRPQRGQTTNPTRGSAHNQTARATAISSEWILICVPIAGRPPPVTLQPISESCPTREISSRAAFTLSCRSALACHSAVCTKRMSV